MSGSLAWSQATNRNITCSNSVLRTTTVVCKEETGTAKAGFLSNALKRCFRLSGVLLKLCLLILGYAPKFYLLEIDSSRIY